MKNCFNNWGAKESQEFTARKLAATHARSVSSHKIIFAVSLWF